MSASSEQEVAATLIAMERAALDRWGNGDTSGFVEISVPDVTYFDPYVERRLDGLEELSTHYEPLASVIVNDGYEMIEPRVQKFGDIAVLTYNYIAYEKDGSRLKQNCTEVYRNDGDQWQIVHTHLSPTKP